MKRVVGIIKFIAERGLVFRGDHELVGSPRNGNFLRILELIALYDDFLAQHIETQANYSKRHTNYLSSTIMGECSVSGIDDEVEFATKLIYNNGNNASTDNITAGVAA